MSYREEFILTFCYKRFWDDLPFPTQLSYSLTDNDKYLLRQIYIKGLTQSELSIHMGVSKQAISQRKRKIFRKIREAFVASGYAWDIENDLLFHPDGRRMRFV